MSEGSKNVYAYKGTNDKWYVVEDGVQLPQEFDTSFSAELFLERIRLEATIDSTIKPTMGVLEE
jgi:hypothetical protein